VREAGAWLDRLTRLLESLEATNSGKRGNVGLQKVWTPAFQNLSPRSSLV
jgi:hypothetical protein